MQLSLRTKIVVLFAVLLSFFCTDYSFSQESNQGTVSDFDVETELSADDVTEKILRMAREPKEEYNYVEPEYDVVSGLYWAMDVFDVETDIDKVENYLMLHECDIYNSYKNDEFEWQKVLKATARKIEQDKKDYPVRISFARKIDIGEYDINLEAFEVLDKDLREGYRLYQVTNISELKSRNICGNNFLASHSYPFGLSVTLTRPLLLEYVPVNPDRAQDFIGRTIYEHKEQLRWADDIKIRKTYSREMYLNMRVRILRFKEFMQSIDKISYSGNYFAMLEGFEIYEDPEMTRLLFTTKQEMPDTKTGNR